MRANGNTKSLRNVPFRPRLYSKNADSTVLHPLLTIAAIVRWNPDIQRHYARRGRMCRFRRPRRRAKSADARTRSPASDH